MESNLRRLGALCFCVLFLLGIVSMGLVAASMVASGGFLPEEPYQTVIHVLVIAMAAWMVLRGEDCAPEWLSEPALAST